MHLPHLMTYSTVISGLLCVQSCGLPQVCLDDLTELQSFFSPSLQKESKEIKKKSFGYVLSAQTGSLHSGELTPPQKTAVLIILSSLCVGSQY